MSTAHHSLCSVSKNFFNIHNNCESSRGVTILMHNDKVHGDVKIALLAACWNKDLIYYVLGPSVKTRCV